MIQSLRTRGLRMFLGAAAIFVVAAGVAWAAIPGSTGAINGCYGKQSGLLRVIDSEADTACLNSETPISWSQQGPQGLQGERGFQGERGPQGDVGPPGPASLEQLDGAECTAAGGATGAVALTIASDGEISFRCVAPGGGDGDGGGEGEGGGEGADAYEENDTRWTARQLGPLSGSGSHQVAGGIAPADDDWFGVFVTCVNVFGCDLEASLTARDGVFYDVYLDENLVLQGAPAGAPVSRVDVFDVPFGGSRLLEVRVHSTAITSYVLSVDLD